MEITLEQLLGARDARYARQLSLTETWPDKTLVCLTVVLPGPVKRDARSLKVAEAAVEAVREVLAPTYKELRDLETGYEGYFLVDGPLLDVKKACCEIENEHPYGRLMDLDVLERVGDTVVPVSRERVGEQPRRCLLCSRPARECMRAHTHTPAEISAAIDRLLGFGENL
jgi:holo-ACP synthase CitX